MKIWFFETDPETGLIKAGYVVNGKRNVSLVCRQGAELYVSTGSKRAGDLQRHTFSPAQVKAFRAFKSGTGWSVEFKEGV